MTGSGILVSLTFKVIISYSVYYHGLGCYILMVLPVCLYLPYAVEDLTFCKSSFFNGLVTLLNLLKTHICICNARRRTSLEIYFIYLGKKDIYCIFKTYCIISVSFHKMSFIS